MLSISLVEIVVWFSVVKTCVIRGCVWRVLQWTYILPQRFLWGTNRFFSVWLLLKIFFIFVDCKCVMVGFIVLFCFLHGFLWFSLFLIFLLLVLLRDRTLFFYLLVLGNSNFSVELLVCCHKVVCPDQWLRSGGASARSRSRCRVWVALFGAASPAPSLPRARPLQGSCSTEQPHSCLGSSLFPLPSQGGRRSTSTSSQCHNSIPQLNAHHSWLGRDWMSDPFFFF